MIHTDAGYYTIAMPPAGGTAPVFEHLWYLKDYLGNNRVLADAGGSLVGWKDYDPFGEEIAITVTNQSGLTIIGDYDSPYRYGGKERNATTSTYDFEARYLSPSFHRFTTMDPLCEKYYGISPYAYCGGNPVNLIDPDGREPVYNARGDYLGVTSEGFTGDIMIYTGSIKLNFESFSRNELEQNMSDYFKTYDAVNGSKRDGLSNDTKSKIWTNVVSHFEGTQIYDEVFSLSTIPNNSIQFDRVDNASWYTNMKTMNIYGADKYNYETTVENLASSIIVHEWYSHAQKKVSNIYKSHRLAYKNVINWKPLWNKTTDKYKAFCLRQLRGYTEIETGRKQVDRLYRNLYNRHVK